MKQMFGQIHGQIQHRGQIKKSSTQSERRKDRVNGMAEQKKTTSIDECKARGSKGNVARDENTKSSTR